MKCEVLIDYCTFTVKTAEDPVAVIKDWLGMDPDLFEDPGYGLLCFDKDLRFSDIHVLYDPRQNDAVQAQGVCVSMSGNGCRTFERMSNLTKEPESPFVKLFEMISCDPAASVSRIDIACDDHDGKLDMDVIIRKTLENNINSRMMRRQVVSDFSGKQKAGATAYIGSPSSDFRVRIYDKALEQNVSGHWIRVELVLRGKSARSFVDLVVNYTAIGQLAAQVLNDKLSFIDRDDSNITRCTVCDWWKDFVDELESVALVSRKVVQHVVSHIDNWMRHQNSPSLYIIASTLGYDHLWEMISAAKSRLSHKQEALIRDFNAVRDALGSFELDNSALPDEWEPEQLSFADM